MCHLSHVYETGASLYYTLLARQREGQEIAQWQAVKQAAGDAIRDSGATITHHHAVGRDHARWLPGEVSSGRRRGAEGGQGRARPDRDHEPRQAARRAGAYSRVKGPERTILPGWVGRVFVSRVSRICLYLPAFDGSRAPPASRPVLPTGGALLSGSALVGEL